MSSKVKTVLIWVGGVFGGGFILYLGWLMFQDAQDWQYAKETKKSFEIKESQITGYKNGVKAWEIKAGYSWTNQSKFQFTIEQVSDGKLYDAKGDLILEHIEAKDVNVNSRNKIIIATQNVSAVFVKKLKKANTDPIYVSAGAIRYVGYRDESVLSSGVTLVKKDIKVESKELEIDHIKRQLQLFKPFQIRLENYVVSANQGVIDVDQEKTQLKGEVHVLRTPEKHIKKGLDERELAVRQRPATLTTSELVYHELGNGNADVLFQNGLKIRQKGKMLKASRGRFRKGKKIFELKGGVEIQLEDLEWLLKKDRKENLKNPDIIKRIAKPVSVYSHSLTVDMAKKEAVFRGKVSVEQGKQWAKADKMIIQDATEQIILTGNVWVRKENGESLRSNMMVLDLESESFVSGESELEFNVELAE